MSKLNSASGSNIPLETVTRISVDRLELDFCNPRLERALAEHSEENMIAHLYRAEDLGELLQSIAANGYMDIEPFIVLQESEQFTVLEGNRRLSAVRLLRDVELARRISQKTQTIIQIPEISEKKRNTLNRISVYRVKSREDADAFIGFKHINGAARWNSYAKARFVTRWHKTGSMSLDSIANQIGDRHATVKRMVHAIYVLEQAQKDSLFDLEDRWNPRFSFSHLYTALSRPDYRKFLGLDTEWSNYEPGPNPVPLDKRDHLREVFQWIYGSRQDSTDPVVKSQNPDIKRLGEVLGNTESLAILRAGRPLEEAYKSTQPAEQKFADSLLRARAEVREVSHHLRGFDGEDTALIDIAEDISETAQAIYERMTKKRRSVVSMEE